MYSLPIGGLRSDARGSFDRRHGQAPKESCLQCCVVSQYRFMTLVGIANNLYIAVFGCFLILSVDAITSCREGSCFKDLFTQDDLVRETAILLNTISMLLFIILTIVLLIRECKLLNILRTNPEKPEDTATIQELMTASLSSDKLTGNFVSLNVTYNVTLKNSK